jgi:predicted unusual protein kinase regulating ubiquinone biosynthesis (AarF/ABC1/UbiB family)
VEITVARLYHPALWKILYSYRAVLVILRMGELGFKALRYWCFRAPLLIVWTRMPGTRGIRPPYKGLGAVLAPAKARPSLTVSGGQMGSNFALAQGTLDMAELQEGILGTVEPPSQLWSVIGCMLRGFFTDMGPAFIKFGQILSMREEIPPTVQRELQQLQDQLPPMSYKQVKKILERELDRPVEEVFEYVEETPIATASLAQVHRAKLRKEQEEVALKIQRPYLAGLVALDTVIICDIFFTLVNIMLPTIRKSSDTGVFSSSYRDSLTKEIDFVLEERSQSRYRKLVTNHPIYSQATYVARTYREYTTTKLLTMELVKNYYRLDRIMDELTPEQLWDFASTRIEGVPPETPLQLVYAQFGLYLEGICHWGIAHGDAHLGNMYALAPEREGAPWRIFLCDYGMMLEASEYERLTSIGVGLGLAYHWDGTYVGLAFSFIVKNWSELSDKEIQRLCDYMSTMSSKYFVETKDGTEKIFYPRTQRGTSVSLVSEMLYGTATLNIKAPPFSWLLFKNMSYVLNMSLSLWTSFNPNTVWVQHVKKYLKDFLVWKMDSMNVTNLERDLPELLGVLRTHDRDQMLNFMRTGEPVRPLEVLVGDDWDVRFGASTKPP